MARGGKRPGAGRPTGSTLPNGAVSAIKSLRHRVPDGVAPELAAVADEALDCLVSVMRGSNHRYQGFQLTAARAVRDEVCGPLAQKVQHAGAHGESLVVEIRKLSPEPPPEGVAP